jgi:hypothetical protein
MVNIHLDGLILQIYLGLNRRTDIINIPSSALIRNHGNHSQMANVTRNQGLAGYDIYT